MNRREIITLGVNHHNAPIELRERLALDNRGLDASLRQLIDVPSISEGVIVSTCNRVELTAASHEGDAAIEAMLSFLASFDDVDNGELRRHASIFRGHDAVRHLFRVAASLDSMVIGEPQILGQLKAAYERAVAVGSAGTILHRCFHRSFSVAKRVRSETAIASRAVSISSAAVELTTKIFDSLDDKTVLLIGAGTMGELAARHLLGRGCRSLIVTNRTFERAVDLARSFRGTPVPFAELERYLPMADIIIGSTAAEDYVLTRPMVEQLLQRRRHRSVFLVDMSVPRNFDPRINELDDAYLYDVDDLGTIAASNLDERSREAAKAEAIVAAEVDRFCLWLEALDAVPTIVALRAKAEGIRSAEVAKTLATLHGLGDREREAIEAMTSAIINKLLHEPVQRLKCEPERLQARRLAAIRDLFAMDPSEEPS